MNENLKNSIQEYILALPREIQEVVTTFDWGSVSSEISKENNLSDEQANDLETETALVLVGLIRAENLAKNIEDKIGTSKEEAEKIAVEIFNKIFKVVSEKTAELIKNKKKGSELSWDQNVKFILSGGDYLFFMDKLGKTKEPEIIKVSPAKNVTDLRDKFTI